MGEHAWSSGEKTRAGAFEVLARSGRRAPMPARTTDPGAQVPGFGIAAALFAGLALAQPTPAIGASYIHQSKEAAPRASAENTTRGPQLSGNDRACVAALLSFLCAPLRSDCAGLATAFADRADYWAPSGPDAKGAFAIVEWCAGIVTTAKRITSGMRPDNTELRTLISNIGISASEAVTDHKAIVSQPQLVGLLENALSGEPVDRDLQAILDRTAGSEPVRRLTAAGSGVIAGEIGRLSQNPAAASAVESLLVNTRAVLQSRIALWHAYARMTADPTEAPWQDLALSAECQQGAERATVFTILQSAGAPGGALCFEATYFAGGTRLGSDVYYGAVTSGAHMAALPRFVRAAGVDLIEIDLLLSPEPVATRYHRWNGHYRPRGEIDKAVERIGADADVCGAVEALSDVQCMDAYGGRAEKAGAVAQLSAVIVANVAEITASATSLAPVRCVMEKRLRAGGAETLDATGQCLTRIDDELAHATSRLLSESVTLGDAVPVLEGLAEILSSGGEGPLRAKLLDSVSGRLEEWADGAIDGASVCVASVSGITPDARTQVLILSSTAPEAEQSGLALRRAVRVVRMDASRGDIEAVVAATGTNAWHLYTGVGPEASEVSLYTGNYGLAVTLLGQLGVCAAQLEGGDLKDCMGERSKVFAQQLCEKINVDGDGGEMRRLWDAALAQSARTPSGDSLDALGVVTAAALDRMGSIWAEGIEEALAIAGEGKITLAGKALERILDEVKGYEDYTVYATVRLGDLHRLRGDAEEEVNQPFHYDNAIDAYERARSMKVDCTMGDGAEAQVWGAECCKEIAEALADRYLQAYEQGGRKVDLSAHKRYKRTAAKAATYLESRNAE